VRSQCAFPVHMLILDTLLLVLILELRVDAYRELLKSLSSTGVAMAMKFVFEGVL